MKKILNSPDHFVDEMLAGLVAAHPQHYARPEPRVIVRSTPKIKGKVGIVTGGGSGHLPVFTGYVGRGLLDGCTIGNVFASPSAEQMAKTIELCDAGAGVLRLYGNYGGDVMNFDMAGEMVEMTHDIETTTVLLSDDIASAPPEEAEKRRGVAGMVYAFKIAGAKAAQMANLAEVTQTAQKAADACRSIGFALSSCTVPHVGKPTFDISDDEMEMGMGIHGEPGIWRDKLKSADEIVEEMIERILADKPLLTGDRYSIMINSLGATPLEELYIMFQKTQKILDKTGGILVLPIVGRYATSMEMAGASITLCHLDDELESLLMAPCDCPFWTQ